MKNILFIIFAIGIPSVAFGQKRYIAKVQDRLNKRQVLGVNCNVAGTTLTSVSDTNGLVVFNDLPAGNNIIQFQHPDYRLLQDSTVNKSGDTIEIFLDAKEEEELEEFTVSITRSTRTIADIPTRIEVISGEELEEKGNMKPGDIRMLLAESTGIQTQQTSATSGNSSIRIQGLDGRYTQIMKDGFPLYAGAASGLGLLQIPPLDLQQVEVIKGSASTIYGGGAIAGLVNLVSKTPKETREIRLHLNGTSAGGLDLNGFYSQKFKKVGITMFASRNTSMAYDPAGNGFSAIPKYERYVCNPKLFLYLSPTTTLIVGVNTTTEQRLGGSMKYIKGEYDSVDNYFEKNTTQRYSSQVTLTHKLSENKQLTFKNSYNYFDRIISIPSYTFQGLQHSTYTEMNYSVKRDKTEWIFGLNAFTEAFKELNPEYQKRDYKQSTLGGFAQNTWTIVPRLVLEVGIRADYVNNYGGVVLPRGSILYKAHNGLTSRLGVGYGYKVPTLFTEQSERVLYRRIESIESHLKLERSYGGTWDVNYRTPIAHGKIMLTVNHLVFGTVLQHPLMLFDNFFGGIDRSFGNGDRLLTGGAETNVKLVYKDFKLFIGYTYTNAVINMYGFKQDNFLTPKHRLNTVLMYEVEDKWKVGLEGYYFSPQKRDNDNDGNDYWVAGFMAEKLYERFSLYMNFENYLNVRQTQFENINSGTVQNPVFRDIYAPLDGFVLNGGIKLRL